MAEHGLIRAFWILLAVSCQHTLALDLEVHTFLENDVESPHSAPVDLGAFLHQCVGSLEECGEGFTASLWFTAPPPNPTSPAHYVISTGGQSAMSQGYYLRRNYGNEFEVGVAFKETIWIVTFDIVEGERVNLVLGWKQGQLDVYVDGKLVGSDTTGKHRVYTNPAFDPFPNIILGKANNDWSTQIPAIDVFNLTHWNRYYDSGNIHFLANQDGFYRGCTASLPGDATAGVDPTNGDGTLDPTPACRKHCADTNKHGAFLQDHVTCSCWGDDVMEVQNFMATFDPSLKCTDPAQWEVFWAYRESPPRDIPVGLGIAVIQPTDKGYTRPNETVTFQMSTTTEESVVFYVDFKDGTKVVTSDKVASHFWGNEGEYVVNITVITRSTSQTIEETVKITQVDEGVKPEVVDIKANQKKDDSRVVEFYLDVVSKAVTDCHLDFGDGSDMTLAGMDEFANKITKEHKYKTAGIYDVAFACSNAYGSTEDTTQVFASNLLPDFLTEPRYLDINIPVVGAAANKDNFLVYLDDAVVGVNISNTGVTLDDGLFAFSGDHVVTLKAGKEHNRVLHTRLLHLQEKVGQVDIRASPWQTWTGLPIDFTFEVHGGDHLHISIDYGDGNSEYVYVPEKGTPVQILRTHTYTKLSKYPVVLSVANDVSFNTVTKEVSIERTVKEVAMMTSNVTELGRPTTFTFEVDMDITPAMPVDVVMDHGDGNIHKVTLGSKQDTPEPLLYQYTYEDYGIYYVSASVGNNMSAIEVTGIVQVGENITFVDMTVDKERAEVGEEVAFGIVCPRGSPLTYTIDTGDGETILVNVPNTTLVGWFPDPQDPPQKVVVSPTTSYEFSTTSSVAQNTTVVDLKTDTTTANAVLEEQNANVTSGPNAGASRRKRSVVEGAENANNQTTSVDIAVDAEGHVLTTVTMDNLPVMTTTTPELATVKQNQANEQIVEPNPVLIVRHKYTSAGNFGARVTVTNPFGGADTWLCPNVVVIPKDHKEPVCSGVAVTVDKGTSQDDPVVVTRSEQLEISANSVVECDGDPNSYSVSYTWKAWWLTEDGSWRPELEVCATESPSEVLVIPSHKLWYQVYKMRVTMSLQVNKPTTRRRRATQGVTVASTQQQVPSLLTATAEVFVKVTPTPLVATFGDEDNKVDLSQYETLSLNMSGSYDPDVDPANKTGMTFAAVSYRKSQEAEVTALTPVDLLAGSQKVVENSKGTVAVYDYGGFADPTGHALALGQQVAFLGGMLVQDENVFFKLLVFKDDRVASSVLEVKVWPTNFTGDLLANLDDLLASGDTTAVLYVCGAALNVLDADSSNNDTDAKGKRAAIRGKLINALETVSSKVDSDEQCATATGVLSAVTAVRDEVSDDSKASAASALGNTADAAVNLTANSDLGSVTNMAGDMVGVASNVMPFSDEVDGMEPVLTTVVPSTTTTTTPTTTTATTPSPFYTTTTVGVPTPKPTVPGMVVITTHKAGQEPVVTTLIPRHLTREAGTTESPFTEGSFLSTVAHGLGITVQPGGQLDYTTTPLYSTPAPTTTAAPTTSTFTARTTTRAATTPKPQFASSPGYLVTGEPPLGEVQEEEEYIPTCCEAAEGLCEWVEPVCDYLAEEDRKRIQWDEKTCNEIHPDDMKEIKKRYDLYVAQQKRIMFAKRKKMTTNAMKAVDDIGGVMLGKSDKESNITIETPKMKVSVAKVGGGNGTMGGGSMAYPGSAVEGQGEVGAKTMESPNAYTYDDSAKAISTPVKSFSFSDANGTEIKMSNMSEPFVIWMDGKPDQVPEAGNFSFLTSTTKLTMNYHSMELPRNDSSLHIMIRPESPNDVYEVYIKYLEFPNETYYDDMGVIPNPEEFSGDEVTAEDEDLLRYTYYPPQDVTRYNGSYKIGIRLIETKLSFANGPASNNYTYSFRVFVSGCRFWNDTADTWDSGGCEVGNLTTIHRTQCLCNHLTSFGGDFVVPPNTIDFNNVFKLEKFLESMPVFCTVIIVLAFYVGILIWARRADKKDILKWGATPLEDNLPSDTYHYQFTVNTGVRKKAGTESLVSFILSGDDGDTGVRRLWDCKRKELPSGSIYNYILSTEDCLGPLTYLRIWHDNSGRGKKRSWLLDQVQVTDLQTGEKFFFLCSRWLAVEEDDGQVERILPVAGLNDLTAFKHLFSSSVRKKLTNEHLWFSVVSRPTRSSFTRVQRVSCCVALLFLTMITNCMFFKADEKVENVSVLRVGPFSFTLHQLFISIVTTAIVFPPSLFIVTVFKKARPKKNTVMQMNQSLSKKSRKFRWRALNAGSSLWHNVEKSRYQKFKESMRNIMSFHQKSKYAHEDPEEMGRKKKKKKGWSLPFWTLYIAWAMCILAILASGFFTILYSMEWGREKSLDWLSTFILSFFQSVIVVQPVKVLLLAAFISCILRKPDLDEDDDGFEDDNALPQQDEELLSRSQKDLQALMMQRKMAATQIAPPDMESLAAARELRLKEIAMEKILKECIIYFFFILVLFFLSYQARDADSFLFSQNIKNTFVENSPYFGSVNAPEKFWAWTHNTLLPNLYSSNWYNDAELDWLESLQMDDRNTIRVGVARLRQLRIKDDTCEIQGIFKKKINHCRDHYSWIDDDTKDYLEGWTLPGPDYVPPLGPADCYRFPEDPHAAVEEVEADNSTSNETSLRDEESPWIYRSSLELKNAPYAGALTMYKGGGYTFTFKRTMAHTKRLLGELEALEWVDVRTRALFLEFTLYNANVNLFGSVIMLVEFMATGSAITRAEVKVFRLSSYVGGFGIIVIFFEVVFLGFTLYFLFSELNKIRKQRVKYFKDFWNLLEFATLTLAVTSIAMYAMKKIFGTVAINVLHESGSGDYVNFVTISVWDELFIFILGTVVFLATIKFIKMLKFNRRMGMLGDTIKLATKDLKYFSATFFIYFFAFCQWAYILFGKHLPNYGSFTGTVEALFAFALGDFDFHEFREVNPFIGPFFFFLFVAIVYIGLMGMFLTIIYDAFASVKANTDLQGNEHEIVDFMMKKFKGVFGWS